MISWKIITGGNRTHKQSFDGTNTTSTYYIRDAQGNPIAVYEKYNDNNIKWSEQHLYGSSRLGMWKWDTVVAASAPVVVENTPIYDSLLYGDRVYELTNHLGNVLSTISNKKIGNDSSGMVNYYFAEVLSQNDYYPFGMLMPGRSWNASQYRYGFNGKENDNDVKGTGNQQDYEMRIYDPRLGKFLSVDPMTKSYPMLTPYQFASNRPLDGIDLDGKEWSPTKDKQGNITDYSWSGGAIMIKLSPDTKEKRIGILYPEGTELATYLDMGNQIKIFSYMFNSKGEFQPKTQIVNKYLTEDDINYAAEALGVEPEILNAVRMSESPRGPFESKGKASILFERHYMYQNLKSIGENVKGISSKYPGLVNIVGGGYGTYSIQHKKLEAAKVFDYTSAVQSASWGSFQVMGQYYSQVYSSVDEFEIAMNNSESEQFKYFINHLRQTPGIISAMKNKNWQKIAKLYNGPKYAEKKYDQKISSNYKKLKDQ